MEQNIWMFADDYLDIPEIRNIETKSYEETERKKLEVRGKALKTIQNVFGKEGIFVFSKKFNAQKLLVKFMWCYVMIAHLWMFYAPIEKTKLIWISSGDFIWFSKRK